MAHEAADLERGELIEVGADAAEMPLDLRMRSGGIFLRLDYVRDAREHELGRAWLGSEGGRRGEEHGTGAGSHALLDERPTTDRHNRNCKTPRGRSSVRTTMVSPVNARATDGRTLLWQL